MWKKSGGGQELPKSGQSNGHLKPFLEALEEMQNAAQRYDKYGREIKNMKNKMRTSTDGRVNLRRRLQETRGGGHFQRKVSYNFSKLLEGISFRPWH